MEVSVHSHTPTDLSPGKYSHRADTGGPTVHLMARNRTPVIQHAITSFINCTASSVGIATGNGLNGQGSIPGREKKCFSTPQRPDGLWALTTSYPMGTKGSFPGGKAAVA
jgi:hypothetical protein